MNHPPVLRSKSKVSAWSDAVRRAGETIAFVPTMGALHTGHLSLVKLAKERANRVVVSIFVNPTQFGPNEDFDAYPRDLDQDLELLAPLGVDLVFAPAADEMYEGTPCTTVSVSRLTDRLCGASRPGHFDGVTTVVAKLFNIVKPHKACFGEKDYQQLATIKKMVTDLDYDVDIVPGPTVREPHGLALSSRNEYLTQEERQKAGAIRRALLAAREMGRKGAPIEATLDQAKRTITEAGGRLDYLEALNATLLEPVTSFDTAVVIATAVFFGKTRLIDNIVINPDNPAQRDEGITQ